ncbi:MAG: alpha/beta fold hydrolase [Nevskiales bacterium]
MNDILQAPPLTMRLADGRQLAWAEFGDRGGRPLLALHGTPGGRIQSALMDAAARQAGVRVIAPDRPGFGDSDPKPDLSFSSYVDDVRQLLAHLGLKRVAVCGISDGGGYALACARWLPDLVSKVVLVSAMAPAPRAARKGTLLQLRVVWFLVAHLPRLAVALMRRTYFNDPSDAALQRMLAQLPAADRRVMRRPEVRALFLGAANRQMLRQGVEPAVHELALYTRPLGFELGEIRVPVRLLHGEADGNVPVAVARYLTAQIPGAELEVIPDAAHLFIVESPQLLFRQI